MERKQIAKRVSGVCLLALGVLSFGKGAVIGIEQIGIEARATDHYQQSPSSDANSEKLLLLGGGLISLVGGMTLIISTIQKRERLSFAQQDALVARQTITREEVPKAPIPALTPVGERLEQEIHSYYDEVDNPVLAELSRRFDEIDQTADQHSL